jgi:predicted nucleic acid-binding protein
MDDPEFRDSSLSALGVARSLGALLVCPIVWAEVMACSRNRSAMLRALSEAGLQFDPFDQACADLAGELWSEYRRAGGARTRIVADFFVGAHARLRGGRLLSRDAGFYRRYFTGLQILPQPQ